MSRKVIKLQIGTDGRVVGDSDVCKFGVVANCDDDDKDNIKDIKDREGAHGVINVKKTRENESHIREEGKVHVHRDFHLMDVNESCD